MPTTPLIVLEIDDNTPRGQPPFTNDVSMWSFEHDFNLATRDATELFRRVHEAVCSSAFRGYPVRVARATRELFEGLMDEDQVTWLTGAELEAVESLLPTGEDEVEKTLRMLFETVEVAGRHFGRDRVRLVFAFH